MIHENSTAYHLYQLLKPEEHRDILELLEKRERRGGKPSQVKAVHLALGKAEVRRDADLYEVLPAAAKWKDLAQAKRKLARTYLDTLVMNADHPAAVVRRMMTELELLAERGQNLSLLYLAQETIHLARQHELYREAIDAYYMWDAAHVVSLNNNDAFPITDKATMLHAMREDAEKLHQLNQAEWFYQQSVMVIQSNDLDLAETLLRDSKGDCDPEALGVNHCSFILRGRYNLALILRKLEIAKKALQQLSQIAYASTLFSGSNLYRLRPMVSYSLGMLAIDCNDELTYRSASKALKSVITDSPSHEADGHYEIYYSLQINYNLKRHGKPSVALRKVLDEIQEQNYPVALPRTVLSTITVASFIQREWNDTIKFGIQFLVGNSNKMILRFTIGLAVLISYTEKGDEKAGRSLAKSMLRDLRKSKSLSIYDSVLCLFTVKTMDDSDRLTSLKKALKIEFQFAEKDEGINEVKRLLRLEDWW